MLPSQFDIKSNQNWKNSLWHEKIGNIIKYEYGKSRMKKNYRLYLSVFILFIQNIIRTATLIEPNFLLKSKFG